MKRLMNYIMLSCKKATLLIETSHARPLSFIERIKLKMHLSMCDKCSGYQKQSFLIENALKSKRKNFPNNHNITLSESTKATIQRALDDKLKN